MKSDDELRKMFESLGDIFTPDPFSPNPSGEDVIGQILIGKVRQTGVPFGLNLEELNEHTLITGRTGAGKTTIIYLILYQLLKRGIPFWAFDFKQDYRHIAKSMITGGPEVLVFNWETFKFNPLRPPEGVKPKLWIEAFINIFCHVYWLLAGSKSILLQTLGTLYKDYGVFSGENIYPTIYDLLDSVQAYKPPRLTGPIQNHLDSVKSRVMGCLLSFDKMLDCDQGFPIEHLLNKNVVFELEGLDPSNQSFLLNIILRYVFQYRISNNQRGGLKHVFVFDESKNVYNAKRESTKELGTSEVARFTSQIRDFGEGLIVSDQMPTELGNSIKANVYSVICMSQSGGPNVFEMARALGLKKEQEEACRTLQSDKDAKVFEAIVKLNGKWLNPFVIHVTPYEVKKDLSEQDVKKLMTPFFTKMNEEVIPRTEYKGILEAKEKEKELFEAELRKQRQEQAEQRGAMEGVTLIEILMNIRKYPFIDQKERIAMLDLGSSSSTTSKYFEELVARGFVHKVRIGLGKGRSTKVLYEITDEGAEFARMDKVYIPGKSTELEHKFWQHTIKEFYQNLDYKNVEIEKRYGIKSVDVGFEKDGKKVAVEIELSTKNLVKNIQRDLDAGCDLILIAVRSKRTINACKNKLQGIYSEDVLEKLEFRVLTDFLT